jgi:LPXTG-site transpeptidase (sortase) family protein
MNFDKINLSFVKKNKKIIITVTLMLGYVLFWFLYFNEKDVGLKNENLIVGQQTQLANDDKKIKNKENQDEDKNKKKEFSESDFNNFWLEINTDDLKIKAPIINGIQQEDLAKGLGRHKTSALPNDKGGNLVISGHRWKFGGNPAYKIFEDLDKLKNGDRVIVHYGGREFKYEVFESGVVKDDKKGFNEVMQKTDKKWLTLYTCTPKYTSLKRLYYRARIVE